MPNIRSSADLRNGYNEISTFCHQYGEQGFLFEKRDWVKSLKKGISLE